MTQQQAEFEILNLQQALSDWRLSHKAPVPIPMEIWSGAARAAAVLGVGPVAKTLRVDFAKLKRLVVGDCSSRVPDGTQMSATFLEVTTHGLAQPLSCRLEVTSREGAVLKGYLDGAAPAEMAAVLREFAK